MGRIYVARFGNVAVSAAQDLFELNAPSDAVCKLLACRIGNSSDAGDAEAELLPIQIVRYATSGSGGSAVTARPTQVGDPAFGGTVEANNTTQGGTPTEVLSDSFNVQSGWLYQPPPEEQIIISPSGILAIELPNAPGDALTMWGSLVFEEIGG